MSSLVNTQIEEIQANQSFRFHVARRSRLLYCSRISSMRAPECSTAGRRTYSTSQLHHEEREAVQLVAG